MRYVFTYCLFGLLTGCQIDNSTSHTAPPDNDSPANFVFILCDDLGYGDLGCYGNRTIKTPVLDSLASIGLKLTSCYAGAPVCSPSRAALMTGKNPNRVGIRDWIPENSGIYLHEEEMTIAELLKSAGYRTGLIGKWHLNSRVDGTEPTPAEHGFDYAFYTQNNAIPSHENPVNFIRDGKPVGPLEGNSTSLIVDDAINFLQRDSASNQPFALFVMFHAPHEPVATPQAYQAMYPSYPDTSTRPVYYGSVSLIDHEVGRLLNALDMMKLTDQTFLMFTSDNGPETLNRYRGAQHSHGTAEPLRGMKLNITEGGYRVPGIIRWPGQTSAGSISDVPVSATDVLPTFCEIAGINPPDNMKLDGTSILPLFHQQPIVRDKPLYWQYDRALSRPFTVSLREGDWKIITDKTIDSTSLYNLAEDIDETNDLSQQYPQLTDSMKADANALYRDINTTEEEVEL